MQMCFLYLHVETLARNDYDFFFFIKFLFYSFPALFFSRIKISVVILIGSVVVAGSFYFQQFLPTIKTEPSLSVSVYQQSSCCLSASLKLNKKGICLSIYSSWWNPVSVSVKVSRLMIQLLTISFSDMLISFYSSKNYNYTQRFFRLWYKLMRKWYGFLLLIYKKIRIFADYFNAPTL